MRKLKGTIVSDRMQHTVVVRVNLYKKHPKYLKYFSTSKRYKADAPDGIYKIGDEVTIEETRPISKEKRWKILDS
jgi:small subunit ribosomal protein S17